MADQDPATGVFDVVVNDEEQFSVWPAQAPMPAGWRGAGFAGTREECLAYIETAWRDMRPLSLRNAMKAQ